MTQVQGLAPVVELAQQGLAELLQHAVEGEAAADLGVAVDQAGDLLERLEVVQDHLPDAGPLHLDRHRPAVA